MISNRGAAHPSQQESSPGSPLRASLSRGAWRCAALLVLPLLLLAALLAPAHAQGVKLERFDIQPFRPTVGPRDLIIVPQTQPLPHLSVVLGSYLSFSLDPLVLLRSTDRERVGSIITNRVELDLMAAVGLFDWVEVGLVMPVVAYQSGGNAGPTAGQPSGDVPATAFGDLSLVTKVPIIKRLPYAPGFGAALGLRVNFPTGSTDAFASDGAVTYNPTVLGDYRFKGGYLLAAQLGALYRPTRQYLDLKVGTVFTASLGGEAPLVRRYGLTTVGGAYVNVPLTTFTEGNRQIPAEVMLGLRWYSDIGVTFTTGFNFGIDCGFGVPQFRAFLAALWVPLKTKEHEAIMSFKKPPDDPDGDGLIGDKDQCPDEAGPPDNFGCPILDTDKDGIPDHLDPCPTLAGRYGGCPRVFASRNKIRVMEKIYFATDQDVILPESFSVLEEVAEIVKLHPEWLEILVEGHADFRASDAYNLDLSQRRAASVMRYLISQGVEPSRLRAQGFGRSRPVADNKTEEGMALNRRVEFTLVRLAPGASTAPVGVQVKSPKGTPQIQVNQSGAPAP